MTVFVSVPKTSAAKQTDLRPGLRERLEDLNTEYEKAKDRRTQKLKAADDEFQVAVEGLQEQRDLVAQLLAIEERRHGAGVPMDGVGGAPTMPVSEFFVRAARATGPKSKDEFRALAEQAGYDIDGRGVHAVIVNNVRGGRLALRADGRYSAITTNKESGKPSEGATPPFMFTGGSS